MRHATTVDFVYKQCAENDKKWALRNAKLRISRKLVFAAGLLRCFFCHLDAAAGDARQALKAAKDISLMTEYMETQLLMTPLALTAKACLEHHIRPETARSIFGNYDRFLAILNNPAKREELEAAKSHEDLRNSAVWKEVHDAGRLSEVHISEVNTSSRHDPISLNAVTAFRSVASRIPEDVPVILETLIDSGQSDIVTEIQRARDALTGIPVSV